MSKGTIWTQSAIVLLRKSEFRQNGVLMMIKVIPKTGIPYYLVPAHGEAHFTDLSEIKQLYPQWTLIEW